MAGIKDYVRHRRLAAIHEASHVLVGRIYGIDGFARIRPARPSDESIPAGMVPSLWDGVAITPGSHKLPRDAQRIIGIAGAVGVMQEIGRPADVSVLVDFMSQTDWKMTGVVPSNCGALGPVLMFTTNYLKRRRSELLALARQLIVESRSTIAGEC